MSHEFSETENLALAVVCAPLWTVALQPTLTLKHARMQHLPLSFAPSFLWRGTHANIYNETGQAGLQFVTTGLFKKMAIGDRQRPLTPTEDALSAAASGVVSALYVSPVELIVIQQQRFGGGMLDTCQRIRRTFGWYGFARGFVPVALRDACYVVGLLSATPLVEEKVEAKLEAAGLSPSVGGLISGIVGGSTVGILCCPLDCVKACMKGDMERQTYKGFLQTTGKLWQEGGLPRFFHGVGWRIANLSGCFIIFSAVRRVVEPLIWSARPLALEGRPAQLAPLLSGA